MILNGGASLASADVHGEEQVSHRLKPVRNDKDLRGSRISWRFGKLLLSPLRTIQHLSCRPEGGICLLHAPGTVPAEKQVPHWLKPVRNDKFFRRLRIF
jgi:hypothetical protein